MTLPESFIDGTSAPISISILGSKSNVPYFVHYVTEKPEALYIWHWSLKKCWGAGFHHNSCISYTSLNSCLTRWIVLSVESCKLIVFNLDKWFLFDCLIVQHQECTCGQIYVYGIFGFFSDYCPNTYQLPVGEQQNIKFEVNPLYWFCPSTGLYCPPL